MARPLVLTLQAGISFVLISRANSTTKLMSATQGRRVEHHRRLWGQSNGDRDVQIRLSVGVGIPNGGPRAPGEWYTGDSLRSRFCFVCPGHVHRDQTFSIVGSSHNA